MRRCLPASDSDGSQTSALHVSENVPIYVIVNSNNFGDLI